MTQATPMSAVHAERPSTTSATGEWRVIRCEDVDSIQRIESEWRAVLDRSCGAHPGAEPSRFLDTLEAIQRSASPFVLLFKDGELGRAVVIGRTERAGIQCKLGYIRIRTPRLRTLRLIYGGVVTDGDGAAESRIADELRSLLDERLFECVFTNKLNLDRALMERLDADARSVRREVRPHWVTDLTPHSYDKTMSGHSSKHRSNLRRLDRKLCAHFNDDVELRIVTTAAEAESFAQAMNDIFEKTYKAGIARGQMENVDWRKALVSRAEHGELRAYLLMAGGEPIAYQTGALHRGVYYAEGTAYLPEHQSLRPGTVLMMRVMQDLCDQGAHCIDWGFGDAEYKRLYGTRSWDESSLHIYGAGWRAQVARALDRASVACAVTAKRLAGGELTNRIRRGWRQRAAKSVATAQDGSE